VTSDAELISCSLAGDDDAFVELVRRHAPAVSAYLVRRAGRGPAEELLGEVWVAAYVSRASYDRSCPEARPWLFGIARNTLRAHWRARSAEQLDPEMPVLLDPWPEVDERIDGMAVLRQALRGLPAAEREIVLLVAWEQLSVAEAARTLGIPAGTARYRLHRARLALRTAPELVKTLTELNAVKEA
jgi:RNA polymerase sigma-70 factor (ECF subfamily)